MSCLTRATEDVSGKMQQIQEAEDEGIMVLPYRKSLGNNFGHSGKSEQSIWYIDFIYSIIS